MDFKDPLRQKDTLKVDESISPGQSASATQPPTLPAGTILAGQYQIISLLGSGGMSHVYHCKDLALDRELAVKMMRLGVSSNPQSLQRFQIEGKAVAKLEHPNILRMFGMQFDNSGQPLLIMELVQGKSLAEILKSERLNPERVRLMAEQICDGLAEAHKQGVVHRDLKPSNIIVVNPGGPVEKIKIVDFGIAKVMTEQNISATQTGEVFGSPAYMSPEQAHGQRVDSKSDQYSLGCVLFEMLTGRVPYVGESNLSVLVQHLQSEPPSLASAGVESAPSGLEYAISRMLSKSPAERFENMQEAKKAMERPAPKGALSAAKKDDRKLYDIKTKPPPSRIQVFVVIATIFILLCVVYQTYLSVSKQAEEQAKVASDHAEFDKQLIAHAVSQTQLDKYEISKLENDRDLETLNLNNCIELNDRIMQRILLGKDKLTTLNLDNVTSIGDDTLMALVGNAPHLQKLSIAGFEGKIVPITSIGVMRLAALPLTDLNISWTNVDKNVFDVVGNFRYIENLAIAGDRTALHGRPDAIERLQGLKNLHWLNLWNDEPRPEDFDQLLDLHTLRLIELSGNQHLRLDDLLKLANHQRLPDLSTLILKSTNLSPREIAKLRKKFPGVEIQTTP
ncbi:MAG TPA: protein kinase [Planktothrix sp.]|jgi:serine/threonine protein kinase